MSRRMALQARRATAPEVAVRRLLHKSGLRFRVVYRVPGLARRSIDIAFPRTKLAVFVDGCFWHGCPKHGVRPTSNGDWWRRKIEINLARDEHTTEYLRSIGWRPLRFWEHENPRDVAVKVQRAMGRERTEPADRF